MAPGGVLVAAALASGCFVSTDLDGTPFLCADEPVCPSGFSCVDGRCVAEGAGPDSGSGGAVDGGTGIEPDGGVLAGDFALRQRLSLANADRGELSDVPVLVLLDAERIDYGLVRADGLDIEFRDSDGAALPHEIERWDPKGTSLLWVRVPIIDGGSDDDFLWMYYGDAEAEVAQDAAAVWSRYESVYHMDADDQGLPDSGGRDYDGSSAATGGASGFLDLGRGREFDGLGQFVDLGTARDFARGVPGVTVEAWIRPIAAQQSVIFGASVNGASNSRVEFRMEADQTIRGGVRTDVATELQAAASGQPVSLDEWTWIAVACDLGSAEASIYIDGELAGSAGDLLLDATTPDDSSDQASIGVNETLDTLFFAGRIDEVRIAPTALDADWMSAQGASMRDQLVSFGPPESL